MGLRVTVIGGGSYQWVPKLLVDIVNTPVLHDAEIVLQDIDPAAAADDGRARRAPRGERRQLAMTVRTTTDRRVRARRRRLRGRQHLDRRRSNHAPRPRDPRPARHQAVGRRHGRAGRHHARAAQHPGLRRHRPRHGGDLPRRVDAQHHQPDDHALPGGDRARPIKTVGLCHEITGAQFTPQPPRPQLPRASPRRRRREPPADHHQARRRRRRRAGAPADLLEHADQLARRAVDTTSSTDSRDSPPPRTADGGSATCSTPTG